MRAYKNHLPKIHESAWIDPAATVIGDVVIGRDSSVWPTTVIRGDVNRIRIGQRTSVQDGSVIHVTHRSAWNPDGYATTIGDDVTIGHKVILHGCAVENLCLIGMGSIILDGAVIRKHTLIGAGSLVPPGKALESGFLWLGSPVRKARELTDAEIDHFSYLAAHYVRLKDDYLKAGPRTGSSV